MKKFSLTVLLLGLCQTATAAGNIVFNPAIMYTQETYKRGDTASKADSLRLNIGAGFDIESGLILGAKYFSTRVSSDDSVFGTNKSETSALGVLVGYMAPKNFSLFGTYLLSPTKVEGESDSKLTYKGGQGFVIDIGFRADLGKGLEIGPQLTYSSISYKKVESQGNTSDLDGTWSDAIIFPYFGMWLRF